MKIRRFMSIYMFLALVFSSAIAMMPDNNNNNNKRKRDDNSFEENKRREIEKVPENSSQGNQNFNINNVQNNFQENGLTVSTQAAFNKQINNEVISKPIIPKHIKDFDYEKFLMWEKSHESNLQGNQKINGNNVVQYSGHFLTLYKMNCSVVYYLPKNG